MKTQDSYASITRGVSQQSPADRQEGQHGEQVNMLSDPVRGLVRRNPLVLEHETLKPLDAETVTTDAAQDANSYRTFTFKVGTNDYDLLYRSRPAVGTVGEAHLDAIIPVRKFLPRSPMELVADSGLDGYITGGISALTSIGRYVLIAGNTVQPAFSQEDVYGSVANQDQAAVYVKLGAYSRTYTITAKKRSTGVVYTATYTTPLASYPGTLDVSDLDGDAPDYQKLLNDRIYAFQSSQSEWTATASAAIVPSAIATKLKEALDTAGFTGWVLSDNYLFNDDIETVAVTDGLSDESMEAVHLVVKDVDELSPRHYVGHVVKVQPQANSDEAYYLIAEGTTSPGPVTWRETAAVVQTPTSIVSFGTVENDRFFWAATPTALAALVLAEEGITLAPPAFVASQAGDLDSAPAPHFYEHPITMLAVFQDRLLIGSGDVIDVSGVSDYLNFYRRSMLTLPADSPFQVYASGTEGDVIRKAVLYDRNLTLYGDNYHYVINGRTALDPANPQLSVQYTIDGTGRSQPVGAGQYVFVLKEDSSLAAVQVLQLQAGVWQDSPAIGNVTKQLRDYINGTPSEMVSLTNPNVLFVRTEFIAKARGAYPRERPWGLYVYQYLDDDQNQRLTDAWHAWEWSASLGTAIGMSDNTSGDGLILYTVNFGSLEDGTPARSLRIMSVSARPDPVGLPYLDGLERASAAGQGLLWPGAGPAIAGVATAADASLSFGQEPPVLDADRWTDAESPYYTAGDRDPATEDPTRWVGSRGFLADYVEEHGADPGNLWTGLLYPSYVDLTSPFMRNHEGKARLYGTLTLTKLRISTTRTAGIRGTFTDRAGTRTSLNFRDQYERISYDHSLFVGRDARHVQVRISGVDWLPLTINMIAWQGDWNNNQGRVR